MYAFSIVVLQFVKTANVLVHRQTLGVRSPDMDYLSPLPRVSLTEITVLTWLCFFLELGVLFQTHVPLINSLWL